MSVKDIRETIEAAIHAEKAGGQLRGRLTEELPRLQDKLVLPSEAPVDALMAFISSYIESVPAALSLVTALSKRLGFFDYAAPFLHMAEDFFLQPPKELNDEIGLGALLDEAFLAHRLMEEVNDHHVRQLHRPLLPMDMTEANIIVHHLLQDPLATRLEQLVQLAASELLHREHLWQPLKDLPGSEPAVEPGLINSQALLQQASGIRLRLSAC
ncbi:MAG: hypothetical protein AAGI11_13330 [Pseudomonadota bacterium]